MENKVLKQGNSIVGCLVALLLITATVMPYGCSRGPFDGLKEGKVVYDVTFDGDDMHPMMKAMLPSEVTTYFGNNRTCMVISMGMNMMETKLVSNAADFSYITMVSAMGKKVALVLNKEQVKENYLDRVNLKIVHTGEEKEIAGIVCKQAMVTDSTNNTYPVYYTEDLAVDNPNWSSPFRDIKGFLMEYAINLGGMRMSLKAKEIINEQQDESFFKIPDGYEVIYDPKEMKFGFN